MKKVNFIFGIHCHQPVGNFDFVLEKAYQDSYLPLLRILNNYPDFKFTIHYSGILLDWFAKEKPEILELISSMAKKGQIEVMTGGYYEPIIPVIPDADKQGQILKETEFIKNHFQQVPRGMWLTERVWEQHIAKNLHQAGVEYITVDDYHFFSAGLQGDKLFGYYVTEEEGSTLKIFPISKEMRYLIPFKMPEETIKYLKKVATEKGDRAVILADDGEKFGVWPGTHQWVFEEKYLENLLNKLMENKDWINFMTFSEYMDKYPPLGRVYLPSASYFEMMEWSLPSKEGKKLEKICEQLKEEKRWEDYEPFFKGGFWRNFFVKYPESNNMHKKMLLVSNKLHNLEKGIIAQNGEANPEIKNSLEKAKNHLWQGQCNCSFWHGVFGGLYLGHLRHAIYQNLIEAENIVDQITHNEGSWSDVQIFDFDKDGNDEVLITSDKVNYYFSPSYGGAMFEFDYKSKKFNLLNTLSRKPEAYHHKIIRANSEQLAFDTGDSKKSIHDLVKTKEKGLEKHLSYDHHLKYSFIDHFFKEDISVKELQHHAKSVELGDFVKTKYSMFPQKKGEEVSLKFSREGAIKVEDHHAPIYLEKNITYNSGTAKIFISYLIKNIGNDNVNINFGSELNFAMLAGYTDDRFYEINGKKPTEKNLASSGFLEGVKELNIVDSWERFSVTLLFESDCGLYRFPVETVSQSEDGFERVYQSSTIIPTWKFLLHKDESHSIQFSLDIKDL